MNKSHRKKKVKNYKIQRNFHPKFKDYVLAVDFFFFNKIPYTPSQVNPLKQSIKRLGYFREINLMLKHCIIIVDNSFGFESRLQFWYRQIFFVAFDFSELKN